MSNLTLHVRAWERPWWGLGVVHRWTEYELEPPPHLSDVEVRQMAYKFREAGAEVRIEKARAA